MTRAKMVNIKTITFVIALKLLQNYTYGPLLSKLTYTYRTNIKQAKQLKRPLSKLIV